MLTPIALAFVRKMPGLFIARLIHLFPATAYLLSFLICLLAAEVCGRCALVIPLTCLRIPSTLIANPILRFLKATPRTFHTFIFGAFLLPGVALTALLAGVLTLRGIVTSLLIS